MSISGRRRGLIIMVLVAAVSLVVGLVAGVFIKSPAQKRVETAPPPRTVLTEPVTMSVVRRSISAGATVARRNTTQVAIRPGDVITSLPVGNGATVKAGTVVLEVNGRPTFALAGALANYRDITPGLRGADVTQLLTALTSLGYSVGGETSFGPNAQAAIRKLYASHHYSPTTRGGTEVAEARTALTAAKRAARDARHDLDKARRSLARAQQTPAVPTAPQASSSSGATETSRAEDSSNRADDIDDARFALTKAEEAVSDADAAVADATRKLASQEASAGVVVGSRELLYVPSFPATATVRAELGVSTASTSMQMVSGPFVATVAVSQADADSVKVGQVARVLGDDGKEYPGTVTSISHDTTPSDSKTDSSDTSSQDTDTTEGGIRAVVTPTTALPGSQLGKELRVMIDTALSKRPVLNVPLVAVTNDSDGSAHVRVRKPDGTTVRVKVVTGIDGNGRIEVTPVNGATLTEKDAVIVGE
ncbi:HlyD family efflux transporter periplasmic adaptor subunit [Acidipropionibacterium timonense]|uniref:HlyD family efflux transporter periplasmic adaptor subunit n=1 Tax=Acidipropionibacterium timonense TaxID=2161818 RepID=UPI00102F4CB1|nr:HlyD family efflux transporter periplasmic adaptor subunit [Acidipropionibacterium timonense]